MNALGRENIKICSVKLFFEDLGNIKNLYKLKANPV